jgi:hypothetical protein
MAAHSARLTTGALLAATLTLCGCHGGQKSQPAAPAPVKENYGIHIDRGTSGPGRFGASYADLNKNAQRKLAFEMTGFAAPPESEYYPQDRSAIRQAAIIDALARALIEARRARGQTLCNFTAKIGPNLTLSQRAIGKGSEVNLVLMYRGEEIRFHVVNGILKSPPQDLQVIQRIFDQTNGEFALLGVGCSTQSRSCMARVAGYMPVESEVRVAGTPDGPSEGPAVAP